MKNVRLSLALLLVGGAVACSAAEPTGPSPEAPRENLYMGSGNGGTAPDSTAKSDSTKAAG